MWEQLDVFESKYQHMQSLDPSRTRRFAAMVVLSCWPTHDMTELYRSIRKLNNMLYRPTFPGSMMHEVMEVIQQAIVDLGVIRDWLAR